MTSEVTFSKSRTGLYHELKNVYCPFFAEHIEFNKYGLYHILKKGNGNPRSKIEQTERLEVLPLVKRLLGYNISPQEFTLREEYGQEVLFWGFIVGYRNENEEFRIKIVIRQKGEHSKHFFSVFKIFPELYQKSVQKNQTYNVAMVAEGNNTYEAHNVKKDIKNNPRTGQKKI